MMKTPQQAQLGLACEKIPASGIAEEPSVHGNTFDRLRPYILPPKSIDSVFEDLSRKYTLRTREANIEVPTRDEMVLSASVASRSPPFDSSCGGSSLPNEDNKHICISDFLFLAFSFQFSRHRNWAKAGVIKNYFTKPGRP